MRSKLLADKINPKLSNILFRLVSFRYILNYHSCKKLFIRVPHTVCGIICRIMFIQIMVLNAL